MALARYLIQVLGKFVEALPIDASTGVSDAGKLIAADSTGKLASTFMPTGIGPETKILTASEALGAGNYVNIYDVGGVFNVRKSDGSTSGKQVDGFVLAAVANGGPATVYTDGVNSAVTGQVPGSVFMSAATPGAGSATPPSLAGQTVQEIGVAISATEVAFNRGFTVLKA